MLTSEQLRAARAMVRVDQKTLATAAGISIPTLKRLEAGSGPLATSHQTAERLKAALESVCVEFIADEAGIGVRLKMP